MAEESKLQSKITSDAKKNGWIVVKHKLTSLPGWPDLEMIRKENGKIRVVWMEVKARGKKPDPLQHHRHVQLKEMGGEVYWIDTWTKYLKLKL